MFSIDEYVKWYFGDLRFTNEAIGLATSVMFLATQCMAHILAIFSANMGVEKKRIFELQMKPEFSFPVFVQTSVAKHYYTCMFAKEGNIYDKLLFEHKGVHLKNSALPKNIVKDAQTKMNNVLTTILDNKKISLVDEINNLLEIENNIKESVLKGEITYFKKSKIKSFEAYVKDKELSPYLHYLFWNIVFREKYGEIDKPPYDVIKIPTVVSNITGVKSWLESIDDLDLRGRLAGWILENKKTSLPTMYIPSLYVLSYGIPKEIMSVISIKKIILDITLTNRIILESLGYFIKPDMLLSEIYEQ
jgi:hypothetical protein